MRILGANLTDVHGDWDSVWVCVGLDNCKSMLWRCVGCGGERDAVIIVIVGEGFEWDAVIIVVVGEGIGY